MCNHCPCHHSSWSDHRHLSHQLRRCGCARRHGQHSTGSHHRCLRRRRRRLSCSSTRRRHSINQGPRCVRPPPLSAPCDGMPLTACTCVWHRQHPIPQTPMAMHGVSAQYLQRGPGGQVSCRLTPQQLAPHHTRCRRAPTHATAVLARAARGARNDHRRCDRGRSRCRPHLMVCSTPSRRRASWCRWRTHNSSAFISRTGDAPRLVDIIKD